MHACMRSIQYNAMQRSATQRNNAMQRNATQHNAAQRSTAQHSTTQHNATQRNATQHNATQHNTIIICIYLPSVTYKEWRCPNMFRWYGFVLNLCSLEIMSVNVLNKIEGVKWATGLVLHTMMFAWTISPQITKVSRVQPLRFLNGLVICPTFYDSFNYSSKLRTSIAHHDVCLDDISPNHQSVKGAAAEVFEWIGNLSDILWFI